MKTPVIAKTPEQSDVYDYASMALTIYGTAVNTDRAVPDFRDGLKPVQRRILQTFHNLGVRHNTGFIKSVRAVGETLGRLHPHGDVSVYESEVSMVHVRYPLLVGQGNFGSYNFSAAAMRYTEIRPSKLAEKLFECWDIAQTVPNFDNTMREALVLPSRLPLLLMNGSMGLGYGITINIPPNNLGELIAAIEVVIDNPSAKPNEVLRHVKGPDYSVGGILLSTADEVREVYKTGKGALRFQCRHHFEKEPRTHVLVLTGLAPYFSVDRFLETCKKWIEDKKIKWAEDETDKSGFRLVIGATDLEFLKTDVLEEITTKVPYHFGITHRHSESNITFESSDFVSIVKGWVDWRSESEAKQLAWEGDEVRLELAKREARLAVMQDMPKLSKILLGTKDGLRDQIAIAFGLTVWKAKSPFFKTRELDMAQYISDMPIRSLHNADRSKLQKEIDDLGDRLRDIGKRGKNPRQEVKRHLKLLQEFVDDRRTQVTS